MKLTNQEIDTLLDALDALKGKRSSSVLMAGMMGLLVSRNEVEAEEHKQRMDLEMANAEAESRRMEESMIRLKAKLIQMRPDAELNGVAWITAEEKVGDAPATQ